MGNSFPSNIMLSVTEITKSLTWSGLYVTRRENATSRTEEYNVIKLQVCNNRQMGNALAVITDYNIRMNYI
jgi:hypothetical protein